MVSCLHCILQNLYILYYLIITLFSKLSDMQEVKLETECKIDIVPHGEEDIKDKAEVRYNTL